MFKPCLATALRSLLTGLFAIALMASGASQAWAANPVVLVVADSLSAAYGLPEKSGWVNLLRQRLAKHKPRYDVVNASISGDTTRGGVARIGAALKEHKPAIVIIELGANDGLRGLTISSAKANLENMVAASKAAGAQPLLVGLELPPNYGSLYTRNFLQMFTEVGKKHSVPVVPSLLAGFGEKRELFQSDTIHPTAAAQPLMLESVWPKLQSLL